MPILQGEQYLPQKNTSQTAVLRDEFFECVVTYGLESKAKYNLVAGILNDFSKFVIFFEVNVQI